MFMKPFERLAHEMSVRSQRSMIVFRRFTDIAMYIALAFGDKVNCEYSTESVVEQSDEDWLNMRVTTVSRFQLDIMADIHRAEIWDDEHPQPFKIYFQRLDNYNNPVNLGVLVVGTKYIQFDDGGKWLSGTLMENGADNYDLDFFNKIVANDYDLTLESVRGIVMASWLKRKQ